MGRLQEGSPKVNEHGAVLGGLSLKRNFSWTFAGNIITTVSQFGMLLTLAHLGSAAMVGQYGLALALTAPVFLLAGMSLRNIQVTDVRNEYSFADYAAVRFISLMTGLVAVAIAVILLGYARETAAVILLVGLSKIIEGMSDIIFGVFQKHEQMDKIAKSMIVKAVATVLVFAIVLWSTDNLMMSVASISVVWLARLLAYDVPNLFRMKNLNGHISHFWHSVRQGLRDIPRQHRQLLSLALLSLPVGLSSSLISLNTNIPRYVIEWSGGAADLGVFTVLAYPLVAGSTVINALSQSSLPRLARYHAHQDTTRFIQLLVKLLFMGAGLAAIALAVAAVIGEELLRIGFGRQYAAEHTVFLVLVLGMGLGFINWFLNSSLHAMRAFKTMLVIQVTILVAVIAVGLVVIPRYGLYGAAWVVTLSIAIQIAIKATIVIAMVRTATSTQSIVEQGTH